MTPSWNRYAYVIGRAWVNGMVDQVAHANGVTDTQALDAWSMRRPGSITSASGGATRWTTGAYAYDGAGNIKQMDTSWFTYDKASTTPSTTCGG